MSRNSSGFMLLNVSAVSLFLVLVGLWYLHKSYNDGTLQGDVGSMVGDGKKIITQGVPLSGRTDLTPAKAANFLSKYLSPTQIKNTVPLSVVAPAPVQGDYYGKE